MIQGEHVEITLDLYDKFRTNERIFKESEEIYQARIKSLENDSYTFEFNANWIGIQNIIKLDTKEEKLQATFKELESMHDSKVKRLMDRSLWKRIFNLKP